MVFKGMSWTNLVFSLVLFSIVFLAVRYDMVAEGSGYVQARPGLLMFTIPGAIAALTSKESPLTVALLGALLAMPVCLLILHLYNMHYPGFFMELAFDTSAIFWCGSGALGIMLCRTLFWHPHS